MVWVTGIWLATFALTVGAVASALSYDDAVWARARWNRSVIVGFLIGSAYFWATALVVPWYWLWLRPRLRWAEAQREAEHQRSDT